MDELLQDSNFWVALSFILFCIVAFKMGYTKIITGMDNKIEAIRKEIEEAEALRVEAQELLAQYRRKQNDALREAEEIIKHAETHAANIRKQAEKDLKELMQRREQQLQERLKRIEESAIQDVKSYASELSVETARDLIYSKMDKKAQSTPVEKTNEQLDRLAG